MARSPNPRVYKSHDLSGPLSKRIEEGLAQGTFTAAEQAIALAMLDDWHQTAWAAAARLAERAACDKAAVSRFVRRLGYANHVALKVAAQAEINTQEDLVPSGPEEAVGDKSRWLMHEITRLESDTKAFILGSDDHEIEEIADQMDFIASRLSRANRIVIAAATTGAIPLVPVVRELFASGMTTTVQRPEQNETLAPKVGNFLVVLHADSSSESLGARIGDQGLYDWKQATVDGVHAVHLVVDGANPQRTYDHRVLHLHDGSDRLASISMLISACTMLIREATRRDPSTAR